MVRLRLGVPGRRSTPLRGHRHIRVSHGVEFGEEIEGFTVHGSEGFPKLPSVRGDQDRRYYAITVKPTVFINLVPDT